MNWRQRIDRADGVGEFTEDDRLHASTWRTCAIGEFMPFSGTFPRDELTDAEASLGDNFAVAVERDDLNGARVIYEQISKLFEDR